MEENLSRTNSHSSWEEVSLIHTDAQDSWLHRCEHLLLFLIAHKHLWTPVLSRLYTLSYEPHCNQTGAVSPQCTQIGASWLARMQQVTEAMGLVRKLPGRLGPPDPPPVLSAQEQWQESAWREINREKRGGEGRRKERRGPELKWKT